MNRVQRVSVPLFVLTVCIAATTSTQNEVVLPEQIKEQNKIKRDVHFTKNTNKLRCCACFFNCEEKRIMVRHVRECHVEIKYRSYQCSNCSERSVRKDSIKRHVREQHEGEGDVIDRRISVSADAAPSTQAILKANIPKEGVHYFKRNDGLFMCSKCPCSYYPQRCIIKHFREKHFASRPNCPCSQGQEIDLCLGGGKQCAPKRTAKWVSRSGTRVKRQCRRDHAPDLPGRRVPAERVRLTPSSDESTFSASLLSMLHTSRESPPFPMPDKGLLGDQDKLLDLALPFLPLLLNDTANSVLQPPESPAAMWSAQVPFEEIQ